MSKVLTFKEGHRAVLISSEKAEILRELTSLRSYRGYECEFECDRCENMKQLEYQKIQKEVNDLIKKKEALQKEYDALGYEEADTNPKKEN